MAYIVAIEVPSGLAYHYGPFPYYEDADTFVSKEVEPKINGPHRTLIKALTPPAELQQARRFKQIGER